MATMENISWSELLKDTNLTAQHGNDGNRIVAATQALQQTAQQFVQVLNERARLFANSAQFDKALHDAAVIRAMLPGSGRGYLCMGDVYCQQGHHAAAISIYEQGLEAIPESDAYYQQLQQHRMTAIANNSKRVDFISQLPLDIVITNIVPRADRLFFSESSCEFLYVSRAWQERILKQPKGLRFYLDEGHNTLIKGHTQLIRFASYVQSLQATLYQRIRLDDLFARGHFSNLKELYIQSLSTTGRLPLIHGLQLVGNSLTHLTLFECPYIQLRDALEACPNLVRLETMNVDAVMSLSPSSSYPKLEHLSLYDISEYGRSHENMVDVLARFPSLRVLEVSPMADSSILPILHKHCPHLQTIYYEHVDVEFGTATTEFHPNRKGIASAYLGGSELYKQDDLIQFLHLQQNSLEGLYFHGNIQINDDAFWDVSNGRVRLRDQYQHQQPPEGNPSESSFPRLTELYFTSNLPTTTHMQMMLWIASNAPNLNTIHIHISSFRSHFAHAMIRLKHLHTVRINALSNDVNDTGIQQFLEHHVALGDQSTLEHVTLRMGRVGVSQNAWIALLSRLTRLKNLELLAGIMPENCIPIMEEIGQGCPALKKLTLGVYDAVLADGLLMPLRKHSNLQCLWIGATSLSDTNLLALCTFHHLKQLSLECRVPKGLLEILQDHIPKVNIFPYG
ncbi:hypothetical protein O0I10_011737 [Lichtheimia ornata]|uniref:Uncharacterized protein n=1 Tax=Lichtheimia ornata TaxID=688661 RepID=A0AAD7UT15_9FUNG|nr:uncharacterized protein O0I10_011737 [Lichtheimia ornata]KAJ8652591.1 hypothetical protein O0I10_011737 [Lichtheimia ornata]